MTLQTPTRSVRECVYDVLRSFHVDTIFGNPGSTELAMFRDFPPDFAYVLGLQEAVVVGMADGHAQARGRLAVANLHSAVGVGNAMGNLYTAFKNRTPLVVIAGQQSRSLLPYDAYLASPQATELPRPYVKWSIEPARAEDVPQAVAAACHQALQEPRGPVLVSVPSDDWDRPGLPVETRVVSQRARPDPDVLTPIARRLAESRRPAFVVGAEVDRSGAWDECLQLAERHDAAVYVAPMSARCSFPEDHPLFMGFLAASREQIVQALGGHDFILVIGAPIFAYHVEGQGPHAPEGATVCQIIEDGAAAARSALGTALVANARLALQDLLEGPPPGAPRARPQPRPAAVDPSGPLTTAYLLQTVSAMRDPQDLIVEEAPTARPVMQQHLPIVQPQGFYTMASGGLGYGMPAAVGIALARPDRRVIAIIGDGSSMYSIQALWTAAQSGLAITFIVINNGRYAALKRFAGLLGFAPDASLPGTQVPGLDFVALARGQGCRGAKVDRADALEAALGAALRSEGPFLLEVVVAPT